MRRPIRAAAIMLALSVPAVSAARAPGAFQSPDHATTRSPDSSVTYRVTIPEPEHHWLQVEATFTGLGHRAARRAHEPLVAGPLRACTSSRRTSSGSRPTTARARRCRSRGPTPYEWNVAGHDGTVRIVYKMFGDLRRRHVPGVDTTHAHMNMPATFMWARWPRRSRRCASPSSPPAGPTLEGRRRSCIRRAIRRRSPRRICSTSWTARRSCSDFVAEHVHGAERGRHGRARSGSPRTRDGAQADVDALAALVKRLVREEHGRCSASSRTYEPGHYTFLARLRAVGRRRRHGAPQQHVHHERRLSLRTPQGREQALNTISHEFFHNWNVERIRPGGLEPFDFDAREHHRAVSGWPRASRSTTDRCMLVPRRVCRQAAAGAGAATPSSTARAGSSGRPCR